MNGAARVEGRKLLNRSGSPAWVQVEAACGKAAAANVRASSAGLNGLYPRPPKSTLPSAIATNAETAAIQSGNAGGRVSPSSSPVMMALKSPMVLFRPAARWSASSVRTAVSVVVTSKARALRPNW